MRFPYLISFVILLTGLLYLVSDPSSHNNIIIAAGLFFLVHFLWDEVKLAGAVSNIQRILEALPVFLLFTAALVLSVDGVSLYGIAVPLTLVTLGAYAGMLLGKTGVRVDALGWLFHAGTLLLTVILLLQIPIAFEKMIGAIIIFHYVGWYVYYYFKLAKAPQARAQYLTRVVLINIGVIALYAAFSYSEVLAVPLGFLFLPMYFYVWTIMHILLSVPLFPKKIY